MLFCDEVDSLFGKRREVKESADRYTNVDTGYLLQRMESEHGPAILTTNIRSYVDTAFTRRLRLIVDFPCPNSEHREKIWRRGFPC
jgi:SpoVK/Ycf46/Vps4 family AAA+-type ATPase